MAKPHKDTIRVAHSIILSPHCTHATTILQVYMLCIHTYNACHVIYKYVCTCENLLVTSTLSLFTEDKTKLCLIPLIWDCCPSMSVCQKNSRALVSTPGVSGLFVGISTVKPSITGACAGCLCKIKPIRSQRYSLGFSFV